MSDVEWVLRAKDEGAAEPVAHVLVGNSNVGWRGFACGMDWDGAIVDLPTGVACCADCDSVLALSANCPSGIELAEGFLDTLNRLRCNNVWRGVADAARQAMSIRYVALGEGALVIKNEDT